MKSLKKYFAVLFLLLAIHIPLNAQKFRETQEDPTGFISMGARNCISIFTTNGKSFVGTGAGGQFALQIDENFNSHWFADWITSNIDNLAQRNDFHSGFSMMPTVFSPRMGKNHIAFYPLGGFCIDYTKFIVTTGKIAVGPRSVDRYSFAAQAGCGATIPISERLNFSLETHYMLHVGNDVDMKWSGEDVQLIKTNGANIEGHFVLAISMDYKICRLWRKKSA